jgi:cysteine desulfurase / selenocysteine lyase
MDLAARTRPDFPVLSRRIDGLELCYLDSAATSLTPRAVIDEISRYYSEVSANVHRGRHRLSEEASDRFEEVRVSAAQFFCCRADELAYVANTSQGLNIVAAGLELSRDDLVLCPLDAHHSNLLPWRQAARVEFIGPAGDGRIDLDHFQALLRKHPRVVALTHCSNVTGVLAPVQLMTKMAKDAGALVVLDAAQSAPHRRLNLHELGVDFAACSAHKMLGPTGIGLLFVSAERANLLGSLPLGGGTVDWVDATGHDLRRAPHRFEAGTPNIGGIYGLGAAIEYLTTLGMANVEAHDALMARTLDSQAAGRDGVRLLGADAPVTERSGIASLTIDGCPDLGQFATILSDSYGVMCRSGYMCAQPAVDRLAAGPVLRLSAYVYNDEHDISHAFDAIDEIRHRLGAIPAGS